MANTEWPPFMTVTEVATIMRVSKMTVYRLIHSGDLDRIRVGRSFRIPEPSLDAYLRRAGYTAPESDHARL